MLKSLQKLFSTSRERKILNAFFSQWTFCNFDLWNTIPLCGIELLRQFSFQNLLVLSSIRCHESLEIMFSNVLFGWSDRITFSKIFSIFITKLKKHLNNFSEKFVHIFRKCYKNFVEESYGNFVEESYGSRWKKFVLSRKNFDQILEKKLGLIWTM